MLLSLSNVSFSFTMLIRMSVTVVVVLAIVEVVAGVIEWLSHMLVPLGGFLKC